MVACLCRPDIRTETAGNECEKRLVIWRALALKMAVVCQSERRDELTEHLGLCHQWHEFWHVLCPAQNRP